MSSLSLQEMENAVVDFLGKQTRPADFQAIFEGLDESLKLVDLDLSNDRRLHGVLDSLVKGGRIKMSNPKEATRESPQGYVLVNDK